MHEWSNETATVPNNYLVKPQPRERAWMEVRGEKTPLSSALARPSGAVTAADLVGRSSARWRPEVRDPHAEDGPGYLSGDRAW